MQDLKLLGKKGEKRAEKFLCARGYKLLGKNVRTPFGEIDIVCKKGDCIVFVEVKYRSSDIYGTPEEAITYSKKQHIIKSALFYLSRYHLTGLPFRFDVIVITPKNLIHYENAFEGEL